MPSFFIGWQRSNICDRPPHPQATRGKPPTRWPRAQHHASRRLALGQNVPSGPRHHPARHQRAWQPARDLPFPLQPRQDQHLGGHHPQGAQAVLSGPAGALGQDRPLCRAAQRLANLDRRPRRQGSRREDPRCRIRHPVFQRVLADTLGLDRDGHVASRAEVRTGARDCRGDWPDAPGAQGIF